MTNSVAQFEVIGSQPIQIKGSAGTLFGYDIGSSDPNPASILFYDKASAPTYGVDQPLMRVLLPPCQNSSRTSSTGIAFANGLYLLIETEHGSQQRNVGGHVEFS